MSKLLSLRVEFEPHIALFALAFVRADAVSDSAILSAVASFRAVLVIVLSVQDLLLFTIVSKS